MKRAILEGGRMPEKGWRLSLQVGRNLVTGLALELRWLQASALLVRFFMQTARLFTSILALAFWLSPALAVETLPPLGADLQQTSVSGLSSGGYMAGQFHAAHSKYVIGAAIVGAGPYACARSGVADSTSVFALVLAANLAQAETGCTKATLSRIADVLDGKRLQLCRRSCQSPGNRPVAGPEPQQSLCLLGQRRHHRRSQGRGHRSGLLYQGQRSAGANQLQLGQGGHAFLSETSG